ncbi:MAG: Bax inhibitor-1/YccA family membrane protein [Acidimicrobiales bacterium]
MPPLLQDSSPRMEKAFRKGAGSFGLTDGRVFTAAGAFDKTAILVVLAIATGLVGYATNNGALILVGLVVGLVAYFVGIFRPNLARIAAPIYALGEGLALGSITRFYATGNTEIVPAAVIFTGGIFLGALVVFRSGLVKVTNRFVAMTMMAAVGFILVALAQAFNIVSLNSAGDNLVIGLIGVVIGTAFLFIDFNFIQRAEEAQVPAQMEWFGAMILMASLVWVYINVLRILGRRR